MIKKFKENMLLVSEYRGNLKGKRETKKKEKKGDSRPEKYSNWNKTSSNEHHNKVEMVGEKSVKLKMEW